MSESKNVAVDILRAEAARREVLIAELQREADDLNRAADRLEVKPMTWHNITAAMDINANARPHLVAEAPYIIDPLASSEDQDASYTEDVPKPPPPRERAFGPRVQHLSPADMPRPS